MRALVQVSAGANFCKLGHFMATIINRKNVQLRNKRCGPNNLEVGSLVLPRMARLTQPKIIREILDFYQLTLMYSRLYRNLTHDHGFA